MTVKRRRTEAEATMLPLSDLGGLFPPDLIERYREAFETSMKAALSMQDELMAFANHRLQANAASRDALFGSKTLEDALKAQQQWMRGAAEDYMQETTKLIELSRGLMESSLAPLTQRPPRD